MVLSQSLKEMEEYGLIFRKQYMEIPPRVEYSLTKEGEDLVPSLKSLATWGKHMQEINHYFKST
ncbi:winged helix-turn-helix transcriptional regulator [Neobacillus sp. D3-1R]|uniref:winged helix-turn-helix transcriptional regulator n=1 Tax=Neobacillus sp. D3-1R TaxID=3445778 RepID=UPI003F9FFC0A